MHLGQIEHDASVRLPITAQHVEDDRDEDAGAGVADAQVAGLAPPRPLRRQHRLFGLRQQPPGLGLEHPAGFAQLDLALATPEQRHAQVLLHLADLLRQRRLRHAEADGGAAEVQFVGNGEEVAELAQVEHRSKGSVGEEDVDGRDEHGHDGYHR